MAEVKDLKNSIKPEGLLEGEDFYINPDGLLVMTEAYHLKRGICCQSACLHCPYGFKKILG